MNVTNATAHTYYLPTARPTVVVHFPPNATVVVADTLYTQDSVFNEALDRMLAAGTLTSDDAPSDPSPTGVQLTALLTTDPDTPFAAEHIFDLGGVCAAVVDVTLIAADPDGETYGYDEGEGSGGVAIAFDVESCFAARVESEFDLPAYGTNLSPINAGAYYGAWDYDLPYYGPDAAILGEEVPNRENGSPSGSAGTPPVLTHRQHGVCPRFVKVIAHAVDGFTLSTYEGPNHPTATFRVDVTFG